MTPLGMDEEWEAREKAFLTGDLEGDEDVLSVFSDDEYIEDQASGYSMDRYTWEGDDED